MLVIPCNPVSADDLHSFLEKTLGKKVSHFPASDTFSVYYQNCPGLPKNNRVHAILAEETNCHSSPPDITGDALIFVREKSRHLHMLMRPELLAQSKVPLSSDAFSRFGRIGAEEHNTEVLQVRTHLFESILPMVEVHIKSGVSMVMNSIQLSYALHQHGVNMRFLPLIRHLFLQMVCSPPRCHALLIAWDGSGYEGGIS